MPAKFWLLRLQYHSTRNPGAVYPETLPQILKQTEARLRLFYI